MRQILNLSATDTVPTTEGVLRAQGVPDSVTPDNRVLELAAIAADIYLQLATPMGLLAEIDGNEFAHVYNAADLNETEAPLGRIYQKAEALALFTVTTGENLGTEISRLFEVNELPLASMLDATASEGTELAADIIEDHYRRWLEETGRIKASTALMRFSPGYCGWHLSAQQELFRYLKPDDIGMTVSSSFLMTPLKSISGVIIAGPEDIFHFDANFTFCSQCRTRSCGDRLKRLRGHKNPSY